MAWGDNLRRLFGVHDLTNAEAADLLGFSQQAVSEWVSKTRKEPRQPNLTTLLHVADFFQIPGDRLARADFSDLLEHELADPERFREVEAEIRGRRTKLHEVGKAPRRKVIAMAKADEELSKRRARKASGKPISARKAKEGRNVSA